MSKDLNLCQFIGRIGKPLELRFLPAGTAVLNFSIACGDDYKDKQGAKVEQTNWINLVVFGKPAEIINQYCDKGSKLYVSGKQQTRKYQAQDGSDRYSTEVVISDFQMLDGKQDNPGGSNTSGQGQQSAPQQSTAPQNTGFDDSFDDDIPW